MIVAIILALYGFWMVALTVYVVVNFRSIRDVIWKSLGLIDKNVDLTGNIVQWMTLADRELAKLNGVELNDNEKENETNEE